MSESDRNGSSKPMLATSNDRQDESLIKQASGPIWTRHDLKHEQEAVGSSASSDYSGFVERAREGGRRVKKDARAVR